MAQQDILGRRATTIRTVAGETQITYHSTVIVAFTDKVIELDHGGWPTATTKTRMNQASRQFGLGYHVFQHNWDWFVDYKGKTLRFDHSIVLGR